MPGDLSERSRQYDAQRLSGVRAERKSHLPIERQAGTTVICCVVARRRASASLFAAMMMTPAMT